MFKAFQYVDLDRSGTLDRSEIRRALDLWGLGAGLDDAALDALFRQCDPNGDGSVSYSEFVDALARDTVTLAAMGKRGLQAKEAMGADDLEAERVFLNLNTGPVGRAATDARNTSYAFKVVGESIPSAPLAANAPPTNAVAPSAPGTPRRGGGTPRRGDRTPRLGGDGSTPRRLPPL